MHETSARIKFGFWKVLDQRSSLPGCWIRTRVIVRSCIAPSIPSLCGWCRNNHGDYWLRLEVTVVATAHFCGLEVDLVMDLSCVKSVYSGFMPVPASKHMGLVYPWKGPNFQPLLPTNSWKTGKPQFELPECLPAGPRNNDLVSCLPQFGVLITPLLIDCRVFFFYSSWGKGVGGERPVPLWMENPFQLQDFKSTRCPLFSTQNMCCNLHSTTK